MNQTAATAAAIVIAFIVFVTVRSELPCFLGVLGIGAGGGNCPTGGNQTGSALSGSGGSAGPAKVTVAL